MYGPIRGAHKEGRARAALRKRRLGSRWYVVRRQGHTARCDTWVGGSADSATSPTSAAPSARRPAAPGAGSRSDRVSRLHGVMPYRGRRHICPPSELDAGTFGRARVAAWAEGEAVENPTQ